MWATCFGPFGVTESAVGVGPERCGPRFYEFRRCIVERNRAEPVSVVQIEHAELGPADPRRILQHGLEDRFQRARRARDDAQHLGRRGLLFERFGKRLFEFGAGFADAADRRSGRATTANARSALRPFASQGHLFRRKDPPCWSSPPGIGSSGAGRIARRREALSASIASLGRRPRSGIGETCLAYIPLGGGACLGEDRS